MLLTLPIFTIRKGFVPDYMHGVLLGVVKALLMLWFNAGEHRVYYKVHKIYPDYFIGYDVRYLYVISIFIINNFYLGC